MQQLLLAQTPHKWEVAIPASALGDYSKTIDFGLYQVDPSITGVANLKGDDGGKTFDGIVYDGSYDDWGGYPHSTIQYATAGTGEHTVDARGALYADSTQQKLYGHAVTNMSAHLAEAGGEFSSAVSIRINNDNDLMLTPRFIAIDANGNIDWNPKLSGLDDGTYEFYLTSTTVNATSKNINDLKADDVIYGKATITVSEGQDEMEWEIDIPTLAKNLHTGWGQSKDTVSIDPNDIKVFESQYGAWVSSGYRPPASPRHRLWGSACAWRALPASAVTVAANRERQAMPIAACPRIPRMGRRARDADRGRAPYRPLVVWPARAQTSRA